MRALRIVLIGLFCAVLLLWGAVWMGSVYPESAIGRAVQRIAGGSGPSGGALAGVKIGGPFTLVASDGHTVTDADFRGRWMLVYFGYTFCPDVCPTELQTIATALDKLGPAAARVVPIFVTVDPARDTPVVVGRYVALFDKRIMGLTGSAAQIADIAHRYGVYYEKVAVKGSDTYAMDHTSFLYLMDPAGRLAALYNPQIGADALASGLKAHVARGS